MTLSKPDLFKFTCKTATMVTDLIMKIIVSLIPFFNFFSQLKLKFRFAFENYNQISKKHAYRKEEGES
jgi:hypothetical protein